jgi:hypothetical protein
VPPPDVYGTTSLRWWPSRGRVVAEICSMSGDQRAGKRGGPVLSTGMTAAAAPGPGQNTAGGRTAVGVDGFRSQRGSRPGHDGAASQAFSRTHMITRQSRCGSWRRVAPRWDHRRSVSGPHRHKHRGSRRASPSGSEWNASALAASPELGGRDATGALAGGRFEITPGGPWSLSTSMTRLRETRATSNRVLDALSLGAGWNEFLGGQVATEVARRRTDGGIGMGWSTGYTRRSSDESVDIRYMHAPGGTRAFARAANGWPPGRRLTSPDHDLTA